MEISPLNIWLGNGLFLRPSTLDVLSTFMHRNDTVNQFAESGHLTHFHAQYADSNVGAFD